MILSVDMTREFNAVLKQAPSRGLATPRVDFVRFWGGL